MLRFIIYAMIYLGSALMAYNIYCFARFARDILVREQWGRDRWVLQLPIALLVLFLIGYLAVGFFGAPDLIISGVLFGGSVFVWLMVLLLRRITEQVQENERLQARLLAAEESSRVKTRFLSSVSHDMRTPLNAILGLNELTLRREDLSGPVRENLRKIGTSATHLLGLINDVLDMNRIESGKLTLNREPFAFREFIDQVNVIIQSQCDEKGLKYVYRPGTDMDGSYIGDAVKLRQVLINILGNSVKFTEPGGTVTLAIARTATDAETHMLRFEILDTGIGMDPEFLPRLFDAFTQEGGGENRYGGSGLGMSIAKRIVEAMGGSIAVESRKGAGSTFNVTLPLTVAHAVETPPDAPEAPMPMALSDRRVLVAEDVDINAEILAALLETEGVSIDRAENGRQAVERFADSPPDAYDAILMDLRMPVMDGLEATRAIRALDRSDASTVPIVALTANAFEEDVRTCLEAGMNAHLSKPIEPVLLLSTLQRLIGQRH